jgi:hypothetical protein
MKICLKRKIFLFRVISLSAHLSVYVVHIKAEGMTNLVFSHSSEKHFPVNGSPRCAAIRKRNVHNHQTDRPHSRFLKSIQPPGIREYERFSLLVLVAACESNICPNCCIVHDIKFLILSPWNKVDS